MTLGNDNGTDGQTDRQTDRVRRNMRPPPREEGRIITGPTISDQRHRSVITPLRWRFSAQHFNFMHCARTSTAHRQSSIVARSLYSLAFDSRSQKYTTPAQVTNNDMSHFYNHVQQLLKKKTVSRHRPKLQDQEHGCGASAFRAVPSPSQLSQMP